MGGKARFGNGSQELGLCFRERGAARYVCLPFECLQGAVLWSYCCEGVLYWKNR